MSRRVQFGHYGPADVLRVVDVPRPSAGEGQVLVRVVAAGITPGEIAIRDGAMEQMFPAVFPSGQGSDFAGRVAEVGSGVTGLEPGDEVMGWSDSRSAQADYVVSDRQHLVAKPPALDWIRAGARVLGIASAANAGRLRAIGVDAFIDTHGDGYVDLAANLGVPPERIDTIIDFAAAQRYGVKTDASPQASTPDVLATMAEHVAWGRLTVPVDG